MPALGIGGGLNFGGGGGDWFHRRRKNKNNNNNNNKDNNKNWKPRNSSSSSDSTPAGNGNGGSGFEFPFKQALTAGSLAFTGDTIAQLSQRWGRIKDNHDDDNGVENKDDKEIVQALLSGHDWLRALRMTSYGFLFYGPGSYVWYQTLDRYLPQPTVKNLLTKVALNQVILGPAVIAIVFAWNNIWQGKASELPMKYRKDALPTLLFGFRFWIPYSVLNFWVVPLQARVGFMSMGSIFWNFILSSTMSK